MSSTTTTDIVEERDILLEGKENAERDIALHGYKDIDITRGISLFGHLERDIERFLVLDGKDLVEREVSIDGKDYQNVGIVIEGKPANIGVYDFVEEEIGDFKIYSNKDNIMNEIVLLYNYDWVEGAFKKGLIKRSLRSKFLYGRQMKVIEAKYIHNDIQADNLAESILTTSAYPVWEASFSHDMRSYYVEVGDYIRITHRAGIAEGGWINQLATVIDKKTSIRGTLTYTVSTEQIVRVYSDVLNYSQAFAFGALGPLSEAEIETQILTAEQIAAGIYTTEGVAGDGAITLIGPDGSVIASRSVTLTVVSDTNNPAALQGIKVEIAGQTAYTDEYGHAKFQLGSGTYLVRLSGAGYETISYNITVN